ncbi:tetratricopeptide repeat protein [Melioribacter sp. OK-6-Me]|uniref:tetratricopeptide repeat protein n=1 Tax=unclassified Melioribacter TaxID=2627329 RepID=UPI003ED864BC
MSIKKFYWGHRYFYVLFFLLALFELLLSRFPLLNTFDYEFSALNGIVLFIVGGLIFLKFSTDLNSVISAYREVALKLLIAAGLVLANGVFFYLFINRCSILYGFAFYFVITLPSLFNGTVMAYIIKLIFRKYNFLILILSSIILFSLSLIEFYLYPQLYFYNPLFGFFSGTLYDESIVVTNKLILYRVLNLLIGLGILRAVIEVKKKKILNDVLIITLVVTISFIFWILKPAFGFATNVDSLKNKLGQQIETLHSQIYAPPDYENGKYAALIYEYYYERLGELFKLDGEQMEVFVFKDNQQKKDLFGSGSADVAKPWRKQIFTDISSLESTLKHEMVHVLMAKYSNPPFYIPLNPALLEGVASALDNNYYGYPLHFMAKTAFDNGYRMDINKLFSNYSFYANYAGLSYVYAGSFVKYLIDKYSIKNVIEFYSSNDFIKAFNLPLEEVVEEYYSFLRSLPETTNKEAAQLYFGGKPIFKKTCVRYAARETNRGYEYYNQGDFLKSTQIFENIYSKTKSYSSLAGLIKSYIAQKKYSGARKILSNEIKYFKETPYIYALKLFYGDVSALNDDYEGALGLFKEIRSMNLNPEYYFISSLRIFLVEQNRIKEFLMGDRTIRKKILYDALQDGNYEALYELCNMMDSEDEYLHVFNNYLNVDKNNVNNLYLLIKLSRCALKGGYHQIAKKIAVKAAEGINDIYWRETTVENLRMVNWFVNFAEVTEYKITTPNYD